MAWEVIPCTNTNLSQILNRSRFLLVSLPLRETEQVLPPKVEEELCLMAQGAMSSGSGLVLPSVLAQLQELLPAEAGHQLQLVRGHVGVGAPVLVHPLDRETML